LFRLSLSLSCPDKGKASPRKARHHFTYRRRLGSHCPLSDDLPSRTSVRGDAVALPRFKPAAAIERWRNLLSFEFRYLMGKWVQRIPMWPEQAYFCAARWRKLKRKLDALAISSAIMIMRSITEYHRHAGNPDGAELPLGNDFEPLKIRAHHG
jgi:hypothetical protein